jgi:hypothetical protein
MRKGLVDGDAFVSMSGSVLHADLAAIALSLLNDADDQPSDYAVGHVDDVPEVGLGPGQCRVGEHCWGKRRPIQRPPIPPRAPARPQRAQAAPRPSLSPSAQVHPFPSTIKPPSALDRSTRPSRPATATAPAPSPGPGRAQSTSPDLYKRSPLLLYSIRWPCVVRSCCYTLCEWLLRYTSHAEPGATFEPGAPRRIGAGDRRHDKHSFGLFVLLGRRPSVLSLGRRRTQARNARE